MTALPLKTDLNGTPTEGEFKSAIGDLYDNLSEVAGNGVGESLTIATGSVTPTKGNLIIDTEAGAASDDLDSILATNIGERIIFVRNTNAARSVVLKHNVAGTGKLNLIGAADVTLTDTAIHVLLEYDLATTTWNEIANVLNTDESVKVSANDTTPGYLNGKLLAGTNISFTEGADGADETLTLDVPAASLTVSGVVEAATTAEMTAGIAGKYPDAAKVKAHTDAIVIGSKILLETQTAASDATIEFTTGIDATYKRYEIEITDLVIQTDATSFRMRTSTDGGSTFDSGAGNYNWAKIMFLATTNATDAIASDTYILLSPNLGNAAGEKTNVDLTLFDPSAAANTYIGYSLKGMEANPRVANVVGTGIRSSAADVNAVQFYMSSGNIVSGTFKLYGVK